MNISSGVQLTILACPYSYKCFNATFKLEKKNQNVTVIQNGFIRSCVNGTYCSDLFAFGKSQLEDNTTKLIAGNGSCCDGDFCNIGNSSNNIKGIYSRGMILKNQPGL
jgi:Fe-S-cluster-containing dehydrogenase component